MPIFAISFDIKFDSPAAYNERYRSLMDAIGQCPRVWMETTSFCLVETPETLDLLERRLWLSRFDAAKDILFIADVTGKACTIRGAPTDRPALRQLMPRLQEKIEPSPPSSARN